MSILGALRQWHTNLRARFVHRYRTQEVLKVYRAAHAQELKITPVENWPTVQAKQDLEIEAIKQGKLEIVDRKSWAWPFLPSSVTRLAVPIMKSCVSADTEFLTRRGWVRADGINKEDYFASLSPSGEFVWQRPKKIMRYRYKGPMVHFNTKGTDILVTPDHRMYGRCVAQSGSHGVGDTQFMFAKDVANLPRKRNALPFQIPLSADYWIGSIPKGRKQLHFEAEAEAVGRKPVPYDIDLMDYVRLLGIWLAEGSCSGSMAGVNRHADAKVPVRIQCIAAAASTEFKEFKPKPFRGYSVSIFQAESSKHFDEIAELMLRLGFRYKPKRHGFRIIN